MNQMKNILLALLISVSIPAVAQITIQDYPIKVRMDVSDYEHLEQIVATSECGEVTVSENARTMSGGCLGTIYTTYTFTDECGNTATAEQFVTLTDNTPPSIVNLPADITVAKDQVPLPDQVEVSDDSGKNVKIDYSEKEEKNMLIRTWVVSDQCGNTKIHQQNIKLKKS